MSKKDTQLNNAENRERLALLGLAADRQAVEEPCPDDERFAAFLEADPASPEQQKFIDHLGVCESCRQKWLILSEELAESKDKKAESGPWFSRRGLLGFVGSACAIAVGVMLYLSIDYTSVPLDVPDFPTKELASEAPADPALRQVAKPDTDAEIKKEAESNGLDSPATRESAADVVSAQQKYRAPMSAESLTSGSATVESRGEQPRPKRASSQYAEEGFSAAAGAPEIHQEMAKFFDSFSSLCKSREVGDPDDEAFKDTLEQGRSLLELDLAVVKPYRELVENIVQLLTSGEPVKGTEFEKLCTQASRGEVDVDR